MSLYANKERLSPLTNVLRVCFGVMVSHSSHGNSLEISLTWFLLLIQLGHSNLELKRSCQIMLHVLQEDASLARINMKKKKDPIIYRL